LKVNVKETETKKKSKKTKKTKTKVTAKTDAAEGSASESEYIPTNDAYPKIQDNRAKTALAVETQTLPADTAAPESVGWYKDAWYNITPDPRPLSET
jgi:hypothetical protein